MLQHGAGRFKLHDDLKKFVYDAGKGTAKWEDTGEVLYVRGLINAMLGVEAIRTAQEKYGNKPLTGEYRSVVGANVPRGYAISRADVAHLMLAVLDNQATVRQAIGIAY